MKNKLILKFAPRHDRDIFMTPSLFGMLKLLIASVVRSVTRGAANQRLGGEKMSQIHPASRDAKPEYQDFAEKGLTGFHNHASMVCYEPFT